MIGTVILAITKASLVIRFLIRVFKMLVVIVMMRFVNDRRRSANRSGGGEIAGRQILDLDLVLSRAAADFLDDRIG